ncbi:MAG TPA: polysulfide reductase NrfD [Bacteroidales bacterium]|nr:polysulfide reductase NrfD [Bacteroidales bacterium]HRZ20639.1 polysulfide reductase NrfD [Bacteroidales bacterium]
MKEEIIVSGRMNHMVDPQLHIWEWPIPLYLFLGGLAAGILIFASFYTLQGKEAKFPTAVRIAPLITPIILVLGLLALFYDLNHKLFFWRLYTTIRLESPMSWGAWTLMVVTPLAFIWSALHIREAFPRFDWKYDWVKQLEAFFRKHIKILAWILIIFSLILGVYTGILFSAFNARPLWNTSILGPLFLTSGMSTGAAVIVLLSKSHEERLHFARLDIVLIGIELFLIVHMFMGFLASTEVQIQAAGLFLGGPYTTPFWLFVVFMGLIFPASLEVLEIKGYKLPLIVAPILVILGGLIFRFIIAYAGQISRWLY